MPWTDMSTPGRVPGPGAKAGEERPEGGVDIRGDIRKTAPEQSGIVAHWHGAEEEFAGCL